MSPEALGLTMLALMVVAIMIGFPTAFTLMSLGITFGFLGMGFLVFDLAVQRVFFVMQNDVLVRSRCSCSWATSSNAPGSSTSSSTR